MANALDAILELKRQEAEQQAMVGQSIQNAFVLFQNARQNAITNKLKQLELAQERQQNIFDNSIKKSNQESMAEYLKLLGGQGQTPVVNNTLPPETGAIPTLADAFPTIEQKFIQTPYMSPSGKVGVSNKLDPEYNKMLELRNNQIKELEDFGSSFEKLASRIEVLDDAIDKTPEFKEGFLSKPLAKGTNFLADINNADWFKNYDLAFNKSFLPASQAENMSKVMSDLDLKTQIKSLGEQTAPRTVKKEALRQIRDSLKKYAASKINAFGVDKKILSKIYPNASRVFGIGESQEFNPKTHKKQKNLKTGEIRIVPR